MSWNYRLFKQDGPDLRAKDGTPRGGEPFYFVGECYYDKNGKPEMHSNMDHNFICGDTPEETKETFDMIAEAFKAPVVELYADGDFKEVRP